MHGLAMDSRYRVAFRYRRHFDAAFLTAHDHAIRYFVQGNKTQSSWFTTFFKSLFVSNPVDHLFSSI